MDADFCLSHSNNCIFFSGLISPALSCPLKKILYAMSSMWNVIVLFIDSEGGDVPTANSLFDHIRSLPANIVTVADGTTQSAAIILFMAGSYRYIMPHCFFRLHQGRYQIKNVPFMQLHEEYSNCLKIETETRQILRDVLNEEQGCDVCALSEEVVQRNKGSCQHVGECIDKLLETETAITSTQAIRFGFAHDFWSKQYALQYLS